MQISERVIDVVSDADVKRLARSHDCDTDCDLDTISDSDCDTDCDLETTSDSDTDCDLDVTSDSDL